MLLAPASVALLIGAMFVGPVAHADHGGNFSRLQTREWRLCISGATAGQQATSWAIGQINATDVNAFGVSCTGSPNVSMNSANYAENWYGVTICSASSGGICTGSMIVRLNARTITTTTQWQKTALHELGHVAGLGHRNTNASVMTQGAAPPVTRFFDAHDKSEINNVY